MSEPAPPRRPPDLRSLAADLEEVSRATERLCTGLSDDQLTWRTNLESWSIAHCFEHLRIADALYAWRVRPVIERARARGKRRGAEEPIAKSWIGRRMISAMRPGSAYRARAPKVFRPEDKPPPKSWRHFLAGQATTAGLLRDAEGLPLNRLHVGSPISRLLRLRLGESLVLVVVHQQRHLLQAQRVREDPHFPDW